MVSNSWYRIGRFLVSILARGILELSIDWKAPLPRGPVILAANHPSTVDPIILTTLLHDRISILIRASLFTIPLAGRSLRFCGHIPVVYGKGEQALEEAEALLKSGVSIAIFPEGHISPLEGGFLEPHTGVARLALRTGVPIVPIGIHLDHHQIRLTQTRVDDQAEIGTWYFHGPYAITVGEPQIFRGDAENRLLVQRVSQQIMRHIILLSGESAQRIRLSRELTWFNTARWWLWSPLRLVRSWSVFQSNRI
ncbi:MAG: 1-acyl-sn-glycerol-3-phosphate acyltransferase [Chloroflexi bacterium]|nr:1-acyl-sn-glycerol-3-phosphate acyltransferase [Chloroflexota bacterium]